MDKNRINSRVFRWAYYRGNGVIRNWPFRVKEYFRKIGCMEFDSVEEKRDRACKSGNPNIVPVVGGINRVITNPHTQDKCL